MDIYLQKYLFDRFEHLFEKPIKNSKYILPIQFGMECGSGWFDILKNLLETIDSYQHLNLDKEQHVTITQVKEKYGYLSVYFRGGDDYISGMVWLAEHLSTKTCEVCGSTEKVSRTKGWIKTLCQNCASKQNKQWEFNNKEERKIKLYKLLHG